MQVFAGSFIYLVFELIGELAGLSGAVGSFLAGMMIGRLDAFQWLERTLSPFKVFFCGPLFLSSWDYVWTWPLFRQTER